MANFAPYGEYECRRILKTRSASDDQIDETRTSCVQTVGGIVSTKLRLRSLNSGSHQFDGIPGNGRVNFHVPLAFGNRRFRRQCPREKNSSRATSSVLYTRKHYRRLPDDY